MKLNKANIEKAAKETVGDILGISCSDINPKTRLDHLGADAYSCAMIFSALEKLVKKEISDENAVCLTTIERIQDFLLWLKKPLKATRPVFLDFQDEDRLEIYPCVNFS